MNTALYSFQCASILPPWAFEVSDNIGRWIWQPPRTEESMCAEEKGLASPGSQREGVLGWISGLVRVRGMREFRDLVGDDSIQFEDFVARWEADIRCLGDGLGQDKELPFLDEIKLLLGRRAVSTDQLCYLVSTLAGSAVQRVEARGMVKGSAQMVQPTVRSRILRAVINAIGESPTIKVEALEFRLWKILLRGVLQLKGQANAAELLRLVVEAAPKDYLDHLGGYVWLTVGSFRALLKTQSPDVVLSLQAEAEAVASALSHYSKPSRMAMFKRAVRIQQTDLKVDPPRAFSLWCLSVLARGHGSLDDLSWAVEWVFGSRQKRRNIASPSPAEISHLLSLHLRARSRNDAFSLSPTDRDTATARLALSVCRGIEVKIQVPILRGICNFLSRQGLLGDVVTSWAAYCERVEQLTKMDARAMALVAMGCNDYRVAVRLHSALAANEGKFRGGKPAMDDAWDWQVGEKYFSAVSTDETIPPLQRWSFLAPNPLWKGRWLPRAANGADKRHDTSEPASRLRIAALQRAARNMSVIIRDVSRMRGTVTEEQEATALGCIRASILWMARHGVPLDNRILEPLARILVQDLARGELGKSTRIRWFLALVAEHRGPEEATAVARQIRRWRGENTRVGGYEAMLEEGMQAALRSRGEESHK
jgi:hypothetical protein